MAPTPLPSPRLDLRPGPRAAASLLVVALATAVATGPLTHGADEARPWAAALHAALACLALGAALWLRTTPAGAPPLGGAPRRLLGLGGLWVLWMATAPVADLELATRALRTLSMACTLAAAFAAWTLGSRPGPGARHLRLALVGLAVVEAGAVLGGGHGSAGTYLEPDHASALLALTAPLLLVEALGGRRSVLAPFALLLVAILTTASPGGIAGVSLGCLAAASAARPRRGGRPPARGWLLVLGLAFLLAAPAALRSSSSGRAGEADPAPAPPRAALRTAATAMLWQAPLTGVGAGHFHLALPRHRPPGVEGAPRHCGNDYLELAAEGGLIGAALGLATLLAAGVALATRARRHHPEAAAALGSLVALATHGLFASSLHLPAHATGLAILVALALAAPGPARTAPAASRWLLRGLTVVGVLGALGLCATLARATLWGRRAQALVAAGRPLEALPWAQRQAAALPGHGPAQEALAACLEALARDEPDDEAAQAWLLRAARVRERLTMAGRASPRRSARLAMTLAGLVQRGADLPPDLPGQLVGQALSIDPHDPYLRLARARLLAARGDLDAAQSDLRPGLRSLPPGPDRLAVLRELALSGLPLAALEGALPRDAIDERLALAAASLEADPVLATRVLGETRDQHGGDPARLLTWAQLARALGTPTAAVELLLGLGLPRLLTEPALAHEAVQALAEAGDLDRARSLARRAATAALPGERRAWLDGLTRLAVLSGELDEARAWFQDLRRRRPLDPDVARGLARLEVERARDEGLDPATLEARRRAARRLLRELAALTPEDPWPAAQLAELGPDQGAPPPPESPREGDLPDRSSAGP